MTNYYEMLGLTPDAGAAAIYGAIDKRYNDMRQLATHPDATVVDEANRNLRLLGQMRATLTDANRRAAYDAGIGVGGAGGLADPTAVLRKAAPLPPPRVVMPTPVPAPAPTAAASDLWVCPNPKCRTLNPEWTQFCLKCQTELVRKCPECGQMKSLVKTGVCGNCGFSFDAATRRVALNSEINTLLGQASTHQANITKMGIERENKQKGVTNTIYGMASIMLLFLIIGYIASEVSALPESDLPASFQLASFLLVLFLLALIMIGVGVVVIRHFNGVSRAIKLKLTREQVAVAQLEGQIRQLREAHANLGRERL